MLAIPLFPDWARVWAQESFCPWSCLVRDAAQGLGCRCSNPPPAALNTLPLLHPPPLGASRTWRGGDCCRCSLNPRFLTPPPLLRKEAIALKWAFIRRL